MLNINYSCDPKFLTDIVAQTVWIQMTLVQEEQSDQGRLCLLFHLHLLEAFLYCKITLFEF